jgi:hypothetical protein
MKSAEEQAAATRRGNAKQKAGHMYCIEGAYYSSLEISARIGLCRQSALARLRTAQKLDGPVTWAKLGEVK